ncbi:MAG: hypothetical protein GY853_02950 [PVC group bacterium]|nr:hypothetical protein [PVC group bacterium]
MFKAPPNMFLRITSLAIIQIFLITNVSFAGGNFFAQNQGEDCLSPALEINAGALKQGILAVIEGDSIPNDVSSLEMTTLLETALSNLSDIENNSEDLNLEVLEQSIDQVRQINAQINYLTGGSDEGVNDLYSRFLSRRSDLAKKISAIVINDVAKYAGVLEKLVSQSKEDMHKHIAMMVENEKITATQGDATLKTAIKFLEEWLAPGNNIPQYIIQGIYKGMLEGRSGDLLYAYGFGWRQFGTAGIRNQAVQSEFPVLLQKEVDEFAEDVHAPILTGPNMINTVTLLQQVAALVGLVKDIRTKLQQKLNKGMSLANAAEECGIAEEFAQNMLDNTITVTYDSRLNGEYFAQLLGAAFLQKDIKVNLMDSPSGVPAGVSIAKGASFFGELVKDSRFAEFEQITGSIFGILISASHSEAEYNGFKAFLAYQKSQVDADSKNMIMDARGNVNYSDINMRLDTGSKEDLRLIFRKYKNNLIWLGGEKKVDGKDYCGAKFVPFYPLYFEYLRKRSPIPYAELSSDDIESINAAKKDLGILYTAFYGGGSVSAANLPGFFQEMGYDNVAIVDKQTKVMDGKFPGHIMPDPGVVEGWMSNLYHFLQQIAGEDLSDIEKAVEMLNNRQTGAATDPDVDRAGMMLDLEPGQQGNVRDAFIDWISRNLQYRDDILPEKKQHIINVLTNNLKDKLLLTANDSWTFMAYYKLQIREKYGLLDKNKLYIIEKSHVTTDGLENVAAYYRKKGYRVYVVDTYVGFTELAKKSRDLFAIAKKAWKIKKMLDKLDEPNEQELRWGELEELLIELKQENKILKTNVPYATAGLPIVDEAIEAFENSNFQKAEELWNSIAHMENILACEESNGYGELGEYIPEEDKVVNAHISEKDGGLALFEFFEILSYGKAVLGKSEYSMFLDMLSEIGYCTTDNQFLKYPGLSGVQEKVDAIESFEKVFAALIQKAIDQGQVVTLFNGKYTVEEVIVYRDKKYDITYNGFPEEGIRLVLRTQKGSKAITTFRPSGTGDNNRDYNWIVGLIPETGTDMEVYRREKVQELEELRADFFGEFGVSVGYADLPKGEFYGLLTAMWESGSNSHLAIFNKALDIEVNFTSAENKLLDAVKMFTFATRDRKREYMKMTPDQMCEELRKTLLSARRNRAAWNKYLSAKEATEYKDVFKVYVNGEVFAEVPKVFVKPWMIGFAGYIAEELIVNRLDLTSAWVDTDDLEVTDEIRFQIDKLQQIRQELNEMHRAEREAAETLSGKLHTPLETENPDMAARYLKGGYQQDGYGVPSGAVIDGSFAVGVAGTQGYYVYGGKEIFQGIVASMKKFFKKRAKRLGKPIKLVIKIGIGGQHTPFQAIAEGFQVVDSETGIIVGEYELGKDYETSLSEIVEKMGIDWDQIAVIPSSKSGSTDETMMIFDDVLAVLLKYIASMKYNIDGEKFTDTVFQVLHEVNFVDGKERSGKDLFKINKERFGTDSLVEVLYERLQDKRMQISKSGIKDIFAIVLGNMFFETTDRVEASRLSAFIRNSGLDKELGEDAPGFGAMFDNVGGRWTSDLHMMTFLAFHDLNEELYYKKRMEEIFRVLAGSPSVRLYQDIKEKIDDDGTHKGYMLGNRIAEETITDIALVLPDYLFWFGKSIEQNFNESTWQKGFVNLVAIKQSQWGVQKKNYVDRSERLVINLSNLDIDENSFNVYTRNFPDFTKLQKQDISGQYASLFSMFYGITHNLGNRLIIRALTAAGYNVEDVNLNDLDNPATKIVQQNLYVLQPFVELGKKLLENRLKMLQSAEVKSPGVIAQAEDEIKRLAREGTIESNIPSMDMPDSVQDMGTLAKVIKQAIEHARQANRKFAPFIYLEGGKFMDMRDYLTELGIEWVMQGTGDQHISYQQVLAQPQKYSIFIISFVPEQFIPGKPAIGFAKGYLHNISPNMVRDYFAEASYRALTQLRVEQGGRGIFLRLIDSQENISMIKKAMVAALNDEVQNEMVADSPAVAENDSVKTEEVITVIQSAI